MHSSILSAQTKQRGVYRTENCERLTVKAKGVVVELTVMSSRRLPGPWGDADPAEASYLGCCSGITLSSVTTVPEVLLVSACRRNVGATASS